jgi:hypothetical protein
MKVLFICCASLSVVLIVLNAHHLQDKGFISIHTIMEVFSGKKASQAVDAWWQPVLNTRYTLISTIVSLLLIPMKFQF